MTSLQTQNKIINTKNYDIVTHNALDKTYFYPYEKEFEFIDTHYNTYGNVPDKETFLVEFPEFDTFEVTESDQYLVDRLNEEHLYSCAVPILEKSAEILKGNSIDAVNFLMQKIPTLNKNVGIKTTDIIHSADIRYRDYEKKLNGEDDRFFLSTGFHELDYTIHGWQRGEELVVLFARTNQGKSWVLVKTLTEAWRSGNNVGLISPEMSANRIGFRFDTLYKHFSNTSLLWGREVSGYGDYINDLNNHQANFFVSTPQDFGGEVTVAKIKSFVQNNNIEVLGIDGISYVRDTRSTRNDNQQAQLTHISEDLFALSKELEIPIIIVVQANRDGVKQNGGDLQLENIRDADGIAYNASKIIAIRQRVDEETLELAVKKNRDGQVGGKFLYQWLPDTGDFRYIPSEEDGNETDREQKTEELRNKFVVKGGVLPF